MCFFSKVSERDFFSAFYCIPRRISLDAAVAASPVSSASRFHTALSQTRRTAFLHHDSIQLYRYPVLQGGLLLHSQNQRLGSRRCFDTVKHDAVISILPSALVGNIKPQAAVKIEAGY
jgi:hypothetical protein